MAHPIRLPPATTILVSLPLATLSEANSREHFRVKAKRTASQRMVVGAMLAPYTRPTLPCVVVMTRVSVLSLDDDNAVSAMKGVRDSIAKWIGVNDRDPRICFHVGQEKCKRGSEQLRVCIRGREPRDETFDQARNEVMR